MLEGVEGGWILLFCWFFHGGFICTATRSLFQFGTNVNLERRRQPGRIKSVILTIDTSTPLSLPAKQSILNGEDYVHFGAIRAHFTSYDVEDCQKIIVPLLYQGNCETAQPRILRLLVFALLKIKFDCRLWRVWHECHILKWQETEPNKRHLFPRHPGLCNISISVSGGCVPILSTFK